jgi:hypothetical protein
MILFRPVGPTQMVSMHRWQTLPKTPDRSKIRKVEDIWLACLNEGVKLRYIFDGREKSFSAGAFLTQRDC